MHLSFSLPPNKANTLLSHLSSNSDLLVLLLMLSLFVIYVIIMMTLFKCSSWLVLLNHSLTFVIALFNLHSVLKFTDSLKFYSLICRYSIIKIKILAQDPLWFVLPFLTLYLYLLIFLMPFFKILQVTKKAFLIQILSFKVVSLIPQFMHLLS